MDRNRPHRHLVALGAAIGSLLVACVGTIEQPTGSGDDDLPSDGLDAGARADADDSTPERIDARVADGGVELADASDPPDPEPDAALTADARPSIDAGTSIDAPPPTADARPPTPDARPPTPDARPPTPDAAPGPGCDDAAWPAASVAFEDQVVVLINQRRAAGATCGTTVKPAVGPVRMDPALREAARCHSLDMAVHGYFSHDSQDGRSPWDRIDDAGYTGSATGENIAAGQGNPDAVVATWMGSEGHCNNIMAGGSNEIGVGYAYQQGSPYGHYWTQTFGNRR